VARHGEALLAAVETMLPMMTVWLRELADDDPGKPERAEEYLTMQRLGASVRQR